MKSSDRKFTFTGAAVLVYCLAVGFGPGLLLKDTPNEDSGSHFAQATVTDPLNQSVHIVRNEDWSEMCRQQIGGSEQAEAAHGPKCWNKVEGGA